MIKTSKRAITARINRLNRLMSSRRPKSKIELACITRQIDDLEHGEARGLIWDERAAQQAIEFVGLLRHWKGRDWANAHINFETWQKELIIAPIFGWKRADSGMRRFTESLIMIPRKNGKTTLAAAIGLKILCNDAEPGAMIYSAATKKEQAKIVFTDAKMIAKGSPELAPHIQTFRNSIFCPKWTSCFQPLSSDHDKMDGLDVACAICDEIQEHPNREIHDKLQTGMGSRRQPLQINIGTAGHEKESIAGEFYDQAHAISNELFIDDSFHFFISEAERTDDYTDPQTWHKANPNLGISIIESFIREQCQKAQNQPSFQNNFRRLHLNQWTSSSIQWLDIKNWVECGARIEYESLYGEQCYGGLDLSTTIDLTAFALAFRDSADVITILTWYWIPEERMRERELRDRVPYSMWVREGFIKATPGNVIDYNTIEADILEISKRFKIQEIAYDPYNATQIVQRLQDMHGFKMIEFRQGFLSMSAPAKEFERLVISHNLRHDGNPVLSWNADCVSITSDPAGNIKLVKQDRGKSSKRIDGIVAAVMATGRLTAAGEGRVSIYESRGILAL